jgi:hypothetical protein
MNEALVIKHIICVDLCSLVKNQGFAIGGRDIIRGCINKSSVLKPGKTKMNTHKH